MKNAVLSFAFTIMALTLTSTLPCNGEGIRAGRNNILSASSADRDAMTAALGEQPNPLEPDSKFAYVSLLCDPSDSQEEGHLRMLLVLKESIRQFDKENDFVVMVHGSISDTQLEILDKVGIKEVGVDSVGVLVSHPEPLRVSDEESACRRARLNVLKLTQYEKTIFVDSDTMVKKDLRFMLDDENDGLVAFASKESPLNSALFSVTPSMEAFQDIEGIFDSDSFDPSVGWMGYGSFPHWALHGHESDWSFWCAHADQGMLFYYYGLLKKIVTIKPSSELNQVITSYTYGNKPIDIKSNVIKNNDAGSNAGWYRLRKGIQDGVDELIAAEGKKEKAESRIKRTFHGRRACMYGECDYWIPTDDGGHYGYDGWVDSIIDGCDDLNNPNC